MNKVVVLCLVLCLLGLGLVSETEGKFLSFYMFECRQHDCADPESFIGGGGVTTEYTFST